MATEVRTSGTPATVWRWVQAQTGGEVVGHRRLTSGNSRTTWAVDVQRGSALLSLVIRVDDGDGPFSGSPLTLAREATMYKALQGRGVSIPAFVGDDETLGALAVERVPGIEAWDDTVLDAVLAELARLHRVDVEAVPLPGFGRRARDDLELWGEIAARHLDPPSPIVELALERLRVHYPGEPRRLVIVHGDAGPRNLLWHEGRLSALLDWEFAHIGDPHDDLAFLTVRTALFGHSLPDFADHVRRHYTAATGLLIERHRLRFWQAVGVLRNLITCQASLANPVRGRDRLVHHMLVPSLDRLLLGLLAELEGVELEPTPLPQPGAELPGCAVMTEIAGELSGIVGAITDPEQRQRALRARHLFSQLAQTWPLAFEIARADAADERVPAGEDTAAALHRLTRGADRRLALFPRARPLAETRLAGVER